MGIISIEQTDRLYWLGRYTERVYTTMRLYFHTYDTMLDELGRHYDDFCRSLDIPQIYHSAEDFCRRYPFDEEDCNSMISNLKRAYDNAIVLREEIGSEALSYIQLAVYEMQKAAVSRAPLLEFQQVLDNLMAFWGVCDDQIANETVRDVLKTGKRVERVDLYGRLRRRREDLEREISRLVGRVKKSGLNYRPESLRALQELLAAEELDYDRVVLETERLLEV